MSLSAHQSARSKSVTWLTPPEILHPLGEFDLDPCCPPVMPWKTATTQYSLPETDGLAAAWLGRVWLNPPFGREAEKWLARMVQHGNGIALIPARTETRMFFRYVWSCSAAVLFIEGRPHFYDADGKRAPFNSGAPICLIAYGLENADVLRASGLGRVVTVSESPRDRLRCSECNRPIHRYHRYRITTARHVACGDPRLTGQLSIEEPHVSPS